MSIRLTAVKGRKRNKIYAKKNNKFQKKKENN